MLNPFLYIFIFNSWFQFPPTSAYADKALAKEAERKKGNPEHADFPNRRRNMVLAAVFALTCMVGYAVSIGMIQVQVFDGDSPKTKRKLTQTAPTRKEEMK